MTDTEDAAAVNQPPVIDGLAPDQSTGPASGPPSDRAGEPGIDPRLDSSRAWMVALAAFTANTVGFSTVYGFGTFFQEMADEFDSGLGATAAVFSVTTFVYLSLGLVTGPLADRFGPRPLVAVGGAIMSVSLLATSRVDSVVAGYVTYGLGVGVGIGCFLVPLLASVGGWFVRRRAFATGLALSGIGLGTLVFVPLIDRLIREVGWRQAYVVLAVITAISLAFVTAATARPPTSAPRVRATVRELMGSADFVRLYIGETLMSTALFVPFVFLVKYAEDRGVGPTAASLLIGVLGASSVIGRIGLGALTHRFGAVRVLLWSFALQPIGYLLWLVAGGSYPLLVVFAALVGIGYGGFIALSPEIAAQRYGAERLGSVLGLLYTGGGIGGLIGPIAAGVLIDAADGGFSVPIIAAVVLTSLSLVAMWPLDRAAVTAPILEPVETGRIRS